LKRSEVEKQHNATFGFMYAWVYLLGAHVIFGSDWLFFLIGLCGWFWEDIKSLYRRLRGARRG
jgi:1,4-dihydroxy-2-naphthoate octaprenyltransferase